MVRSSRRLRPQATSVRVLARRLAVSQNFINDRYGSKADFWRAVVQAAMREREDALIQLNRRDDSMPDDALARLVLEGLLPSGAPAVDPG
jgi:TetR/AcrR family transcriptional regulator